MPFRRSPKNSSFIEQKETNLYKGEPYTVGINNINTITFTDYYSVVPSMLGGILSFLQFIPSLEKTHYSNTTKTSYYV